MKEEILLNELKKSLNELNRNLDRLCDIQHDGILADRDDFKNWVTKLETNTNKIKYQNANEEEVKVLKTIEDIRDIVDNTCEIIKKEGIK